MAYLLQFPDVHRVSLVEVMNRAKTVLEIVLGRTAVWIRAWTFGRRMIRGSEQLCDLSKVDHVLPTAFRNRLKNTSVW